jgi:membrane-associated phospholipid phosphatase
MNMDELLFGGQPSLAFCRLMPWTWFNELMNFAYLSFYFIIALTVLVSYKTAQTKGCKAAFVLLFSFFFYYLLFIIFPVMGPQFYLSEPDNCTPDTWPFRAVMLFLQDWGEKPTGAFPSSHVGITVICMILLYTQKIRKLFWWLLPLAVLLLVSTVYIKAHYLIDVVAGLLTAPFLYKTGCCIWKKTNK